MENVVVKFGLEAQGHIPEIEKILSEIGSSYYAWEAIGRRIGWEPLTACSAYYNFVLEKKNEEVRCLRDTLIAEIERRQHLIISEPDGVVRETMIHALAVGLPPPTSVKEF